MPPRHLRISPHISQAVQFARPRLWRLVWRALLAAARAGAAAPAYGRERYAEVYGSTLTLTLTLNLTLAPKFDHNHSDCVMRASFHYA